MGGSSIRAAGGSRASMIAVCRLCVVAAIVLAVTGPHAIAGPPRAPASAFRLHAELVDQVGLTSIARESLVREVEQLWRDHGLEIVWSTGRRTGGTDDDLVFLLVRGSSRESAVRTDPRADDLRLGAMTMADGRPGRRLEASYGSVMYVLSRASYAERPFQHYPFGLQQRLIGRALGRVLSHEIGHYLYGPGHAGDGLMKASLRADDLLTASGHRIRVVAPGRGPFLARLSRESVPPSGHDVAGGALRK